VGGINARPLPFGPENALWPTISSRGHLAYEISQSDANIWRMPLNATGEAQRWIASTRDEADAQYSPDGRRILFLSKRRGSNEIWIANADGSSAWQLTNLHTTFIGWPQWSPDGSTIVFDSPRDGPFEVFTISAAGGSPRKLTAGKAPCGAASYSRDGRWIYYHCIEAGARQIWRMPAEGGRLSGLCPASPNWSRRTGGIFTSCAP
jgi:TolB protein